VVPTALNKGEEHRGFPRIPLAVRVAVTRGSPDAPSFSAFLQSENISVSGAFLRSTFFLPVGTDLHVSFRLGETGEQVRARAELVRHQQAPNLPSGFGIHFEEFFDQTEVALARLFIDARLQAFAEDYLGSARAKTFKTERDRVVDALAAWELLKISQGDNLWRAP
jgi:hypothetical protein